MSVFRAENYPSGVAVDNKMIVVDYGSYINPHSNPDNPKGKGQCVPAGFNNSTGFPLFTGVGDVNGCNNDILRSVSTDGGATFTGSNTPPQDLPSVNDEGTTLADQWWEWLAKGPNGVIADAYYDRKYGNDQSTGYMDITLATGSSHVQYLHRCTRNRADARVHLRTFQLRRVDLA